MWLPEPVTRYINNRFGSKRSLVKGVAYNLLGRLGVYKQYEASNLGFVPERYVFACAGNICRSPLAEAVIKAKGIPTASFGLDTRGGDHADPRAVRFGKRVGLDLSKHKTTMYSRFDFRPGDLVVVMEPKHIRMLNKAGFIGPILLLGTSTKKRKWYIADPFNTTEVFFTSCEALVKRCSEALIQHG